MVLLESAFERRRSSAWAVSLGLHAAGLLALVLAPHGVTNRGSMEAALRNATPLVAPPAAITQRDPNRGAISREFSIEGLLPRPPLRVPAAVPPVSASADTRPPAPARPSVPEGRPTSPRALPDAPKLESGAELAQAAPGPPMPGAPAPPPQIEVQEKPKIAFETPSRPGTSSGSIPGLAPGRLPMPGGSVDEAMRAAIRQGPGGTVVGDIDLPGSGGLGGGLNLPGSSPPRNTSTVEMMSDPLGVDFKPYLIQVLASVRRNWRSVIPESARLGRQGRVKIQFAIARNGSVPKLVIALPSGTDALDRAAVAGISASNPFPPLPAAFKGEQVRLQLTFTYNLRD